MSVDLDSLLHLIAPAQLAQVLESAFDIVLRIDRSGKIVYASAPAAGHVARGRMLAGMPFTDLLLLPDRASAGEALQQAFAATMPRKLQARITARSSVLWFDLQLIPCANQGGETEVLVVGRDISVQQINEERLRYMATRDSVTGLPNRFLLSDRMRMAIAQGRRAGTGFAVLALDLDGFKKVNEALGHAAGDALLRMASKRARRTLRDADTLARIGGDEFVAVLPGITQDADVQLVARRLISALQLPFEIHGQMLYISTSIGAALYPNHGDTEVQLLSRADSAMARAKDTGKARCVVYDPAKFGVPAHDIALEAAMFEGVRNGEFVLHYQPIVDAHTRRIMGFEALMRWMRPGIGLVPPVQFIPMAESNGLINLLGAWALKAACMQLRQFEEAAGRELYVSVNVSPRQFRHDRFIDMIDEAVNLSGVDGSQLLLEITEGILMADPEHAEQQLNEIITRNVRIAIDDFGTGYSSLAYLKRFPIDSLKIDRAFTKDLPMSEKDLAICNVILHLADNLQLSTVAEGIETEQQLQCLSGGGCTFIQGYHTGRPLPPDEVIALLKSGASEQAARAAQGAALS